MVNVLVKNSARRSQQELDTIVPMLQKIQFFKEREISHENYVHIAETLQYEFIFKDQTVFKQGEQGEKFYIIIDGEVCIKIFNKAYDAKKKELAAINQVLAHLKEDRQQILDDIEELIHTLKELPPMIANDIKEIDAEIKETKLQIESLQNQLDEVPEFIELQKLGSGKSFGEKALIMNSLRAANVCCTQNCHFAVINKNDYDKVLRKIELKN